MTDHRSLEEECQCCRAPIGSACVWTTDGKPSIKTHTLGNPPAGPFRHPLARRRLDEICPQCRAPVGAKCWSLHFNQEQPDVLHLLSREIEGKQHYHPLSQASGGGGGGGGRVVIRNMTISRTPTGTTTLYTDAKIAEIEEDAERIHAEIMDEKIELLEARGREDIMVLGKVTDSVSKEWSQRVSKGLLALEKARDPIFCQNEED